MYKNSGLVELCSETIFRASYCKQNEIIRVEKPKQFMRYFFPDQLSPQHTEEKQKELQTKQQPLI